jgi:transposase
MRARPAISNEQWAHVAPAIAAATSRGPKGRDDRRFFEAVVWILRTGAPWRDLPGAFGKWSRSYRRFRRWALAGRWETLRQSLRRAESLLRYVVTTGQVNDVTQAFFLADCGEGEAVLGDRAYDSVALSGWRA